MPTSPTSLSCRIGEPACEVDLIDLHTIEYAPGVSFLDEYGNTNMRRSLSRDENERAELTTHMNRVRADGFARLRKQHGLDTQGTHDMIDSKLVGLASQISLKLDGITTDRDAAIAIIRATSSTKLDELKAKSTEYLGFRAEYSVQSFVRDSAFATAPSARRCGCSSSHADGVDAERDARTRMMRDNRLASSQPLSITTDVYAADTRIDEAERCEAIRAKHAKPADHFRAPRSVGQHADGGQDREAIARAKMHEESRNAHRLPLTTEGK